MGLELSAANRSAIAELLAAELSAGPDTCFTDGEGRRVNDQVPDRLGLRLVQADRTVVTAVEGDVIARADDGQVTVTGG